MTATGKGQHVVFTHGIEFNITDHDHLVIIGLKDGPINDGF